MIYWRYCFVCDVKNLAVQYANGCRHVLLFIALESLWLWQSPQLDTRDYFYSDQVAIHRPLSSFSSVRL